MHWKEIRESKAFQWGRDLLLFAIVLGAVMAYQTWSHIDSGEAAPAFDLAVLDSDRRVSSESLQGKATLIYFWAPWCGVCEASSHNVTAVHEDVADDYNILSIALEYSDEASVRDFAMRNGVAYPVLLGSRDVTSAYSVGSFPTVYVLDSDGEVVSSVVGYPTELGLRARLWWASLQ